VHSADGNEELLIAFSALSSAPSLPRTPSPPLGCEGNNLAQLTPPPAFSPSQVYTWVGHLLDQSPPFEYETLATIWESLEKITYSMSTISSETAELHQVVARMNNQERLGIFASQAVEVDLGVSALQQWMPRGRQLDGPMVRELVRHVRKMCLLAYNLRQGVSAVDSAVENVIEACYAASAAILNSGVSNSA
jgi:hypothetical protein